MRWLGGIAGAVLLALMLWDAFETIILPRRVSGRIRITKLFYRSTWIPWRATAQILSGRRRDAFLSFFGPLSLILLLALWAVGIVVSFGLLQWADGSALNVSGGTPGFATDLYMSGTTFVTLGLGDVAPSSPIAKALTAAEAGMGFAFLAVVIGYFPVIYQAFSRREVAISLLDARAGSPPSASELLWRHRGDPGTAALIDLLRDWERWAADVLESHLSYPPLAYFRSQHYNESWLAALTTILDASAVVMIGLEGWCARQAELTFAMARHAVVDLAQVFSTPPKGGRSSGCPLNSWGGCDNAWRPAASVCGTGPTSRSGSPSCAACTSPTSPRWRITWRCLCRRGCARSNAPTIGRRARGTGWCGFRPGGRWRVARKSTSDVRSPRACARVSSSPLKIG